MKAAVVKKPVITAEAALRFAAGATRKTPRMVAKEAKKNQPSSATTGTKDGLTIPLSKDALKRLKKLAAKKEISVEALVTGWIEKHL